MGTSFSSDVEYNFTEAAAASNLHTAFNVSTIPNAAIGQETYTKNWIEDWIEDAIAADVIPRDELIARYEWKDSHGKARTILRGNSGIISLISSSIFIWMIMRSHDRLSTTQHRLLLGLCISDILSSLSHSTFNATAPSDYDYMAWNARGNLATSTAQGFILTLGIFSGLYYNASLNLYFLAVVKYKKSDEFIRKKVEPFLHLLPIAVAISYSIYLLVKQQYNDHGGILYGPMNSALHCYGYKVGEIREGFEIPCYRGIDGYMIARNSRLILMFIPAVIMMVSLGMIYCAVRTQEKKLAGYGVGALRSNLQQQSVSTPQQHTVQENQSCSNFIRGIAILFLVTAGIIAMIFMIIPAVIMIVFLGGIIYCAFWIEKRLPFEHQIASSTRSNNVQSQRRAVMHKAFGYTFAWLLSYGLYLIGVMNWSNTLVLVYIVYICLPLQGLFNLLIFMHPKIVAAKKSGRGGATVSWCNAFSTAFWSKGKKRKNRATSRSNLRGRSNRRLRKNRNENAGSGNVQTPMFGGIKKKTTKKRNKTRQEEEEKCEIQVPDNLNPNMTRAMYSAACPAIYERNIVPSSSAETSTAPTVNLSASIDDMVGVKKVDFAENVHGGHALSDIVESSMESEDEEKGMSEAEIENKEIVPMAAAADMNEQKETSMEDEDEEKGISAYEEEEMNKADKGNGDTGPVVAAANVIEQKEISMEDEDEDEDEEKGISADGEEEMIEAEIGNKDEVRMVVADVKEISTEGE